MRLALWCTNYFRGFGGAEKFVNDLLNGFADRGTDLFLIAGRSGPGQRDNPHYEPLHPKVRIYQNDFSNPFDSLKAPLIFPLRLAQYLKAAAQLWRFFRRSRLDLVHLHFVGFDVLLLALYKYFFKYRLVVTFTGTDLETALTSAAARLKVRIALKCADAVTAVSQDLCRKLETSFFFSQALYVPNGIDSRRIRAYAGPSLPEIREDQFVYCGRLVAVKRVRFLIDAFHQCLQRGCAKDLYIAGGGEETGEVRAAIRALGISNRVIALGALTHRETVGLIDRSRCLLLSSLSEGCPLVVLEALALGKPVIAPEVGGLKDLLAHGEGGYLYPPDRQDMFCELILKMAADRALATKAGAGGPMIVNDNFELESVLRRYLGVYDAVTRRLGSNPLAPT
jgi:glycosyltransferase involved in cell wall biosynthesis